MTDAAATIPCRWCAATGRVRVSGPKGFRPRPAPVVCASCGGSGQLPAAAAGWPTLGHRLWAWRRHLGYRSHELVERTGWPLSRLVAMESGELDPRPLVRHYQHMGEAMDECPEVHNA